LVIIVYEAYKTYSNVRATSIHYKTPKLRIDYRVLTTNNRITDRIEQ